MRAVPAETVVNFLLHVLEVIETTEGSEDSYSSLDENVPASPVIALSAVATLAAL